MTNATKRFLVFNTLIGVILLMAIFIFLAMGELSRMDIENKGLKGGNVELQNSLIQLQKQNDGLTNQLQDLRTKLDDLSKRAIIIPNIQQQGNASRGGNSATPRVYRMEASAYDPDIACTGKTDGMTASGVHGQAYRTIAAPSYIPLGTIVYIPQLADGPNHGIYVVEDRGGAIYGNKLDMYMNTHKEAQRFGRRKVDMYIIR